MFPNQKGNCDCVPVVISSKACQKCGRRGIITKEAFDGHMIDLAQYHYVLTQIAKGEARFQEVDMAKRVLAGERSVTPK